ncbi:MAG: methyltransferase domain protein [Myxococcaceae bacterium]|nr:methyltransferase domain protein [Myxococcaceae bacterium]
MLNDISSRPDQRADAPPYPARLLLRVAEQTGISYRLSALDLSNDGGALAVELARTARTVTVALQDERERERTAANIQRHQARVQLRMSDLHQLAAEGTRYWLATIGRSLGELDGASMLTALDPLIERGGAIAVLGIRFPRIADNAWYHALLGADSELRDQTDEEEALLLRSCFDRLERVSVFEQSSVSVEQALAQLRARSSRLELEPTRRALRKFSTPDGQLRRVVEGQALIARREHDRSGRWS